MYQCGGSDRLEWNKYLRPELLEKRRGGVRCWGANDAVRASYLLKGGDINDLTNPESTDWSVWAIESFFNTSGGEWSMGFRMGDLALFYGC